jgi:hypothetical protein
MEHALEIMLGEVKPVTIGIFSTTSSGRVKMKRILLIGWWLFATASLFADVIRGTYTYTYGDRETLVDARQTCKDLALREAIESYAVFVESSTEVDNFQLKEDAVQAISAGVLKNMKVTNQQEQGRTVTISIEAEVSPEEVKSAIEQRVAASKIQPADTVVVSTESDYLSQIADYEKQLQAAESARDGKRFAQAESLFTASQAWLELRRPTRQNPYLWHMQRCLVLRAQLITDLAKLESLESQGRKLQTALNKRIITRKALELRRASKEWERMRRLSKSQETVRQTWIDRTQKTLNRVRLLFGANEP